MIRIVGSFVSPYVRKVLACLNLKGVPYEVDPITPFFGNDEFERLSPLRRIPVLIDGDFSISDSSVICAYLDDVYEGHPLLPAEPKDRARARWFEEFADTQARRPVHLGALLPEDRPPAGLGRARRPGTDRQDDQRGNSSRARLSRAANCPPRASFSAGSAWRTSRSPASSATALMRGFETDAKRWPRTAAFVERTLAHACFADLLRFEDVQRSVEIKGRRQALLDAGAPLTADTMGLREPRRGLMRL